MRVFAIAAVVSMLAAPLHAQDSPTTAPANSRPQLETDTSLPCLPSSSGAGDGNRTRTISLEG